MTKNWKNISIIVGIIAVLGGGSVWNVIWYIPDKIAESKAEERQAFEDSLITKATRIINEKMVEFATNQVHMMNLANTAGEARGYTTEESIRYLTKLMDFADEKMIDDSIWKAEEQPFLRELMSRKAEYFQCGYVLADKVTHKPKFFVMCNGDWKKIYFGRPRNTLIKDVYYYRDENDRPIILSSLSHIMI